MKINWLYIFTSALSSSRTSLHSPQKGGAVPIRLLETAASEDQCGDIRRRSGFSHDGRFKQDQIAAKPDQART
jgi:hypothetical protein